MLDKHSFCQHTDAAVEQEPAPLDHEAFPCLVFFIQKHISTHNLSQLLYIQYIHKNTICHQIEVAQVQNCYPSLYFPSLHTPKLLLQCVEIIQGNLPVLDYSFLHNATHILLHHTS